MAKKKLLPELRDEIVAQMIEIEAFYAYTAIPRDNEKKMARWFSRKDLLVGRLMTLITEYRQTAYQTFNPS